MRFGTKVADAPERTTDDNWIKTLKKGDTRVRFLQEVGTWIEYYEHFNPNAGGYSFPCTGDRSTCPGCTSGLEKMRSASRRYAVNVLHQGNVEVFKIPAKLKDRMVTRSERNGGTITDRDYVLIRSGDGIDSTEYDYDQLEKSKVDLSQFEKHDIERLLYEAFRKEWPDFALEGYEPPPKSDGISVGGNRTGSTEDPPSKPAAEQSQPKQEQNGDKPEDQEITVDQLREMKLYRIHELLDNQKITDYPDEATKPELIDWIVQKFSG